MSRPRGPRGVPRPDRLTEYLLARQRQETYLVAVLNANTAAPFMLSTGRSVMTLGGFGGNDRLLTPADLARRVAEGQVRFFWLETQVGQQRELVNWVTQRCAIIPPAQWQGPGVGTPRQLYDCAQR